MMISIQLILAIVDSLQAKNVRLNPQIRIFGNQANALVCALRYQESAGKNVVVFGDVVQSRRDLIIRVFQDEYS